MPIEMRADFQTHWTTFGEGETDVLLFHCTMGSVGAWRGLTQCLSEGYHFTAFDLPGHGKSGAFTGERDFQDLSSAMGRTFLDRPMHLVGHSFGGSVALRLALEEPDKVRSLVLIEPVMMNLAFADDPEFKVAYDADHRAYFDAFMAGDHETAAREFSLLWGDGRDWMDIPEFARTQMIDKIPMIYAADSKVYRDEYGFSEVGRLSGISVPVLLMEGGVSHFSVAHMNAALERRLSNSTRKTIEGAGHMLPITHPQATAQSIADFWETALGV
ncbi:MAG: alpha/beta hydrolase [Rhodobacteraceae bacterium]|nr:alpha/beta hydrolase [Paracoccaceae bacterium]